MTLRRKLFRTLSALAVVGLLVIAVTGFTVSQWSRTEETLQRHYARSLLLREVQSLGFRAVKEVPDAVAGEELSEARHVFETTLTPANEAFATWADLADDDAERQEVELVRAAFERLVDDSRAVFDLIEAGRMEEAAVEVELAEDADFAPFERLVEEAILHDRAKREVLRQQAEDARQAATAALVVASLGVLSLTLLLGAFLSGDLFRPLHDLRRGLRRLAQGDAAVRIDTDRSDELGGVGTAFNSLAEQLQRQSAHQSGGDAPGESITSDANRLALLRLADRLRSDAGQLSEQVDGPQAEHAAALAAQAEGLHSVVERLAHFAVPLDLHIAPTSVVALLHDVLGRFSDEIVRRGVAIEVSAAPGLTKVPVDRAKVRETLAELVRNALDALPDDGGSLALRARHENDALILEVIDDGSGITTEDLSWLFDSPGSKPESGAGVGLRLATSVVEQHGGRLLIEVPDGGGTIARVVLPLPA